MKYGVLVTRDATASITIYVEADSPEKAEALALEEVGDGLGYIWELDEGNQGEVYIADPGNCAYEIQEAQGGQHEKGDGNSKPGPGD
jgi:hypothetical protein